MATKIGMSEKNLKQAVEILSLLLANTYVLYLKTQKFHWNVVDQRFYSLHKMFEEQYEQLAEAIDVIAERIRMLEHPTPATMKEFLKLATLKETDNVPGAQQMIRTLVNDHEQIIREIRPKIAELTELHDDGSADMLIGRIREHEKTAWMLRSHL
ncbi:MAG: DNA starvation/stationary phase protection protein [Chlamydiales bacterium 38-26]|nr:DNA starvation/stationary phase protection protein [Chlamydiales bacterium]OJV07187.1 MAG: DNA starvation/stationary phase protection protein [Chlamydiales bacterium 38-26]